MNQATVVRERCGEFRMTAFFDFFSGFLNIC